MQTGMPIDGAIVYFTATWIGTIIALKLLNIIQ